MKRSCCARMATNIFEAPIMPAKTRLEISKPDIVKLFEGGERRVYARNQIEKILSKNRAFWRLAQATTTNKFIDFLLARTEMTEARFEFPKRTEIRYTWGDVPTYEVVHSLKETGYFTHYTAIYLHDLTDQIPKTIYFNFEQKLRGGGGQLAQASIDRAFKSKCRVSNNTATYQDSKLYLLNGMNTGQLGMTEIETRAGSVLRLSNVERTLIDATVRPIYSGGVFEVAKAFERAREKVSVNKLAATLRKLNYTYPYHQAIGFYLERAGYKQSQLDLLRQFEIEFDFYLTHKMEETEYNRTWRLHIPKGF
jgi:hypothetical protein